MSRAPWVAHFGLDRTPFGKSIAAKDLFIRQAHQEAVARINFCIVESAIGVVTGDVGAGKTVSVRAAVSSLDPTRHQVIYIANPAFGTRGLYVTIVRSLGAEPRYLKAELMVQAADLLAAEAAERHRRVVLIVDEAHLLEPAQLEELRLLTNSEMDSASPFAGILVGVAYSKRHVESMADDAPAGAEVQMSGVQVSGVSVGAAISAALPGAPAAPVGEGPAPTSSAPVPDHREPPGPAGPPTAPGQR